MDFPLQIQPIKNASTWSDLFETRGVVWVASYPKSGNTWIHSVIKEAGRSIGAPQQEMDIYTKVSRMEVPQSCGILNPDLDLRSDHLLLKTHSPYSPEGVHPECGLETLGYVHIIRNPLDVLLSYINYTRIEYSFHTHDREYQKVLFRDLLGMDSPVEFTGWQKMQLDDIPTENFDHALMRFADLDSEIPSIAGHAGSYFQQNLSWRKNNIQAPHVLLHYEECLREPEKLFDLCQLFDFSEADVKAATARIKQRTLSQKQEKKYGFSNIFFNKMAANYYTDYFSRKTVDKFCLQFSDQLNQLGYPAL